MHPRLEELLSYLETTREELRLAVELVPVERRDLPPANGGWSPAQVLEHLAIVEGWFARRFSAMVSRARAEGAEPDAETASILASFPTARLLDRARRIETGESALPSRGLDWQTALRELESNRRGTIGAIQDADGVDLTRVLESHFLLGALDGYQWIAFLGGHEARHAAQIREAASTDGQ